MEWYPTFHIAAGRGYWLMDDILSQKSENVGFIPVSSVTLKGSHFIVLLLCLPTRKIGTIMPSFFVNNLSSTDEKHHIIADAITSLLLFKTLLLINVFFPFLSQHFIKVNLFESMNLRETSFQACISRFINTH